MLTKASFGPQTTKLAHVYHQTLLLGRPLRPLQPLRSGTGWHWALQCRPNLGTGPALGTRVPAPVKALGIRVPTVSVTLQFPVEHCVQDGTGPEY